MPGSSFDYKRTLILAVAFMAIFAVVLTLTGSFKQSTTAVPLQKTTVGKSTEQNVKKLPNILSEQEKPNGVKDFTLDSGVALRPDEVQTKNGVVVFERVVTIQKKGAQEVSKISLVEKRYGSPEKVMEGSLRYGPFVSYYVYGNKGLAFIGNPSTDEVYEVQIFIPMSADEFIKQYGGDIKKSTPQPEGPY